MKFVVSFLRLLKTISNRSGLVTLKASCINSLFEGSLEIITAIEFVRALGCLPVRDEGGCCMEFLLQLDPGFQESQQEFTVV